MQARQQGSVRARMSRSPRARRAHIAQMLSLGGMHSLRASIKLQAKQREQEKRHEAYKRELHEAVLNLPTLPAAPVVPASHATVASHAAHTAPVVPVATPALPVKLGASAVPKGAAHAPPVAMPATPAHAAPAAPIPPPVATSAHDAHAVPMGAPMTSSSDGPDGPEADTAGGAGTSGGAGSEGGADTEAGDAGDGVASTTQITAAKCNVDGSCHEIVTQYEEDKYLAALVSCTSALSVNLQHIESALYKNDHALAFSLMATILVGPVVDPHSSHSSRAVLASLLEGNVKAALPYFAIKELFAASMEMSHYGNVQYKHILKILDMCLAWHQRETLCGHRMDTVITKLRKEIALKWCTTYELIEQKYISALRELSLEAADIDKLHDAIPPTLFYECVTFYRCDPEDQKWTRFVLRLLSADEADVDDLYTDLASCTDTRMLLGNIQAACLLLRSRRLEDGEWHTTYVDACLSHLSTLRGDDHGPLVEALRALEFLNKQTTNNKQRSAHITHMIRVSEGIRTVNEARGSAGATPGSKTATYELVSGSATDLAHALQTEEHDKQKRLPCFFAAEVLATLQKSTFVSSLAPKEQMRITRAFDARFPNMAEATMLALGETWLELAARSAPAFGTPFEHERLEHLEKSKRRGRQPPSGKHPALLVLSACAGEVIDKPPRGAYLKLAQLAHRYTVSEQQFIQLIACIENDPAFQRTFLDDERRERNIADYLAGKIEALRPPTNNKIPEFGHARAYAMSPSTAV
jgi:hypothetical protein